MSVQTPSVSPSVENPVQPAFSTKPNITPSPPKSFLSNKLLIIVIILIILLGAGGTYLALNSKPNPQSTVSKALPTSVPTPTVDPTASWKTYTNLELKYSLKYPPDWNAITDGSLKINGIRISIGPNATGGFEDFNTKVSITAITPGLNTNISSAKDLMVVGNPPPKVYPTIETITFKGLKVYKKIQEDASDLIAFDKDGLVYSIYLFHRSHIDNVDPKIYDQILSTFKFTDVSQAVDASTWKTHLNSNAGYSFKYPNDYQIMENQKKSVDGVTVSTPNTITILSPVMQIGIHYESGVVNLSEVEVAKKFGLNINGNPYTINGKSGYIFVDTPLGPYGSTIIYITVNNKSYTFTIESQTSYTQYKQYLDQILSTFKFTQ